LSVSSHTVSAIAVLDLAQELIARDLLKVNELGKISKELMQFHQLILAKPDVNAEPVNQKLAEARLPESDLVSLWTLAERRSTSTSLGFEIGATVTPEARGILAHWLSHCESLKDVFSVFSENVALLNRAENWSLSESDQQLHLSFRHQSSLAYPQIALERSLVAFVAWTSYFTQRALPVTQACFAFAEPTHSEEYRHYFGENLVFNADQNIISLDAAVLSWPINGANNYVRSLLAERSALLQSSLLSENLFQSRVIALLEKDLPHFCRLNNTLDALHVSRAGLYRKLKAEGVGFSDLVKAARLNCLERLRQRHDRAEVVAQQLGFGDVSSYYRFLKRETGRE